jgi:glycosyltransferase involved in cell wall biosynthesis
VSPSREDSFGLPVLEAMACGLPVVTSAAAGVSEIVRNGENGFVLQDPMDSHSLARLIKRFYEDPAFRRAIGESAALSAQEWTWDRCAETTWRLLGEVASRK